MSCRLNIFRSVFLVLFLFCTGITQKLYPDRVYIVAVGFLQESFAEVLGALNQKHEVHFINTWNDPRLKDPDVDRLLVFNYPPQELLSRLPIEKRIFFGWEPHLSVKEEQGRYGRIYTWNEALIDGVKFFRFHYPVAFDFEMIENLPSFEDKKLCTLVASNWTQERIDCLNFFSTKPVGEFTYWGRQPPANRATHSMYRGAIPGFHSSEAKAEVLKEYKFCICYENTIGLKGYVTEKIWSCFRAGCVPIYWGAPNIEDYIPKGCFIDYRDFESLEELYQFLQEMPLAVYEEYLENIRRFLGSSGVERFTMKAFTHVLEEAIEMR